MRLHQQMGGHRGGEKHPDGDQQFLNWQAALPPAETEHRGEQRAAHAQGAGFGGGVQAHGEVAQTYQTDRAHQREQPAPDQQRTGCEVEPDRQGQGGGACDRCGGHARLSRVE
jgi:hypothetical protein